MPAAPEDRLAAYLDATGLAREGVDLNQIKMVGEEEYVLIKPLMFHWTMIRGPLWNTHGYDDRWCYADAEKARTAFDAFPADAPADYEPDGWHRHPPTGRRRENADPEAESFRP